MIFVFFLAGLEIENLSWKKMSQQRAGMIARRNITKVITEVQYNLQFIIHTMKYIRRLVLKKKNIVVIQSNLILSFSFLLINIRFCLHINKRFIRINLRFILKKFGSLFYGFMLSNCYISYLVDYAGFCRLKLWFFFWFYVFMRALRLSFIIKSFPCSNILLLRDLYVSLIYLGGTHFADYFMYICFGGGYIIFL